MTIYDRHLYGNPETVLMRKQAAQEARHKHCGDCLHHLVLHLTETQHACAKGRRYGYRCDFYKQQGNK
jgi:hypothetical protein